MGQEAFSPLDGRWTGDWAGAQVLYRSLLTLILSHAHGRALPARVGAALEIELLEALHWRLGPFIHSLPPL